MTTPTSTDAINDDEGGEAIDSAYKRQQQCPIPRSGSGAWDGTPQPGDRARDHPEPCHGICNYCGRQGHGDQERTAHRLIHCPAFGTTCSSCGRQNHTAQMCWQSVEHESAIYEQVDTMVQGTLHHQTWDPASQFWTQRKSPHIDVTILARVEDFSLWCFAVVGLVAYLGLPSLPCHFPWVAWAC